MMKTEMDPEVRAAVDHAADTLADLLEQNEMGAAVALDDKRERYVRDALKRLEDLTGVYRAK